MKKFLSLLSVAAWLLPIGASAMTASELVAATGSVPASKVSMQVQSQNDGMYVTFWLQGTVGLEEPTMDMRMTIDTSQNGQKTRTKGALRIIPEGVYIRLDSIPSELMEGLTIFSLADIPMNTWMQIAPSGVAEMSLTGSHWYGAMTNVSENASDVFTVREVPSANGKTYVVGLKPDAAAALAQSLLDMMGGDRPVVQDFFPWRSFAESIQFETIVKADAAGALTSRATTMSVQGSKSYLRVSSTEEFLREVPRFGVPEGAIPYEHTGQYLHIDMTIPSLDTGSLSPIFRDVSFDTIDTEISVTPTFSATCSATSAMQMISFHRSGECPVEKVSRRNLTRSR